MKKYIIEVVGGLGNQLFQYAFYEHIRKKTAGVEVVIYTGRFNETSDNKGYQIPTIFNVKGVAEYTDVVHHLIDDDINIISRLRRKIAGRKSSYILEVDGHIDLNLNNLNKFDEYYFRGLWQNYHYAENNSDQIRKSLIFRDSTLAHQWNNFSKGLNKPVALHVRRGDYISNPKYKELLGDVCNIDYYKRAISYLKDNTNYKFDIVIFSDDVNWVKENFLFLKEYNVRYSIDNLDYVDLYFMSKCYSNIIANSTFSWWGAWLNCNPNKCVIAPSLWYKNKSSSEIIPPDWVKV